MISIIGQLKRTTLVITTCRNFLFLSSTLSSLESDISDMKRSQRDAYFAINRKRLKKYQAVNLKRGTYRCASISSASCSARSPRRHLEFSFRSRQATKVSRDVTAIVNTRRASEVWYELGPREATNNWFFIYNTVARFLLEYVQEPLISISDWKL